MSAGLQKGLALGLSFDDLRIDFAKPVALRAKSG
jgi:hypothetical protein